MASSTTGACSIVNGKQFAWVWTQSQGVQDRIVLTEAAINLNAFKRSYHNVHNAGSSWLRKETVISNVAAECDVPKYAVHTKNLSPLAPSQ